MRFADGSSRSETSPFCCGQSYSERSDRNTPQSVDALQDVGEELPGRRELGQLKEDPPGVTHHPAAHFDQLDLKAPQGPVLEFPE